MPGEVQDQRTTYAYDVRGNIVRTTAPEGAFTRAAYDAYDRPVLIAEPNGLEAEYTYTDGADDAVVAFRDAHGNATTWAYDSLGRLTDPLTLNRPGSKERLGRPGGLADAKKSIQRGTDHSDPLGFFLDRTTFGSPGC